MGRTPLPVGRHAMGSVGAGAAAIVIGLWLSVAFAVVTLGSQQAAVARLVAATAADQEAAGGERMRPAIEAAAARVELETASTRAVGILTVVLVGTPVLAGLLVRVARRRIAVPFKDLSRKLQTLAPEPPRRTLLSGNHTGLDAALWATEVPEGACAGWWRAQGGLDRLSACVMMANTQGTIVYANPSMVELFTRVEADLKKALPHFDARNFVGQNIDAFHRDPTHQRRLLDDLTATHYGTVKVGVRTFRVVTNPVFGSDGRRHGTVIEWKDLTDEIAVENEINAMVHNAVHGDLSRRIAVDGKTGFSRSLSTGINDLAGTVEVLLTELAAALEMLAKGDLQQRIECDYDGLFGRLGQNFNATAATLARTVGRIDEAASDIAAAAAEVSTGSADLAKRTEQQAAAVEQTTASMQQLRTTVRANADAAQQANTMAVVASEAAERGAATAQAAVETMQGIARASRDISEIIGVIDEIAFQTNLLALNAAVEAACAGEAGRSFAVVAQEVRDLAQRSAAASRQIKTLILASDEQVRNGVELVHAAGGTLSGIVESVRRVSTLIAETAAASSEQAVALDEISAAIGQMDESTQKNAALVEETTAAAQAMAQQAGVLRRSMAAFTLP